MAGRGARLSSLLLAALLPAALLPAACAAPPPPGPALPPDLARAPLPPMHRFGPVDPEAPRRANADMARDFLDLAFRLEGGQTLPVLTRFDAPIRIAVTGARPPVADHDLALLLARLRHEARLDVALAAPGAPANLTVVYLPQATLRAQTPGAACFVAPNVAGWAEYRQRAAAPATDWTRLTRRGRMGVFLPGDAAPQEIRDCLNEELAQAVGPVNDLYRLPDSVFNDDNIRGVLTGFDMLMLRVYTDPALQNGMTRDAVAARLPAILRRLNPAGERPGTPPLPPDTPEWRAAIARALGPRGSLASRRAAARVAVSEARAQGWTDARAAFGWTALARLSLPDDGATALAGFVMADRLYARLPATGPHRALIAEQMAAFALSTRQATAALDITAAALPAATRAQNAALMAGLMMIRARALAMEGSDQTARAQALWLDSLGWARYGFGSDAHVRAAEAAVLALDGAGKD